ncbi:MAG: putative adhesin [Endozoicomonas sp.]
MATKETLEHIEVIRQGSGREAVVLCHGGYTPKRDIIRKGSGEFVLLTEQVTFHSKHDTPAIGMHGLRFAQGEMIEGYEEVKKRGEKVTNYSLTADVRKYGDLDGMSFSRDVITIKEGIKVHLKDLLNELALHNMNYENIHCFHCRIDKLHFVRSFHIVRT